MDNTDDIDSEDDFDYYYNSDPYDYDENESPEVNEGMEKDEKSNIEVIEEESSGKGSSSHEEYHFELEQVKKEISRRVEEKEIEFANTRKNYAKAMDGMQVALETETKAKVELSRIKKKRASVLEALACSRLPLRSSTSASSFFLMRDSSTLALVSVSRATCMPSMALA